MSNPYEITDRNRVRRVAKRGVYDRQQVHAIIDAALLAHVGILDTESDGVAVIPMCHARMDDCVLFHGARSSRLLRYLSSGQPVSVSFAMADGLVLAKSLFHHSMNYRSAVIFGRGSLIEGEAARLKALKAISDKILPGRWEDARGPNDKEMSATAVVSVQIESASAKIRTGDPIDDEEDFDLPVWSGVVPIGSHYGEPAADGNSQGTASPEYLDQFLAKHDRLTL